jgi:hypothetical protein
MDSLFDRRHVFETELVNCLRKLPLGEFFSFNALTGWLGRVGYRSLLDGKLFEETVAELERQGKITVKVFEYGGWTVPGFVNRAGYFVERPRKKRK